MSQKSHYQRSGGDRYHRPQPLHAMPKPRGPRPKPAGQAGLPPAPPEPAQFGGMIVVPAKVAPLGGTRLTHRGEAHGKHNEKEE